MTAAQFDLFTEDKTLAQAFWEFERKNPAVYRRLVALARKAKEKGITRYSVDALFHVLRWEIAIETRSEDEFTLNDHHTAFYARLIMDREPDLQGFFKLRTRRAK